VFRSKTGKIVTANTEFSAPNRSAAYVLRLSLAVLGQKLSFIDFWRVPGEEDNMVEGFPARIIWNNS